MKYYKYLDLEILETTNFLKEYCKKNKEKFNSFWNDVDTNQILIECPAFQKIFDPLNITIKKISIIITSNTSSDFGIHKDYVEEKVRINLPILNCEYSVTNFYTTSTAPIKKFLSNGVPYYFFERKNCTLVDSLCLNKPAALNVHELHQVVVTNPDIKRVSCTISFKENINHLLND